MHLPNKTISLRLRTHAIKTTGFSPFFLVCSYQLLYKVTNSYNLIEYKYITETSLKRQTVPDVNRYKDVCLLKHCFTMYTQNVHASCL
jgi:hypothetical protein